MVVYANRSRTDPSPKRANEPEAEFYDRISGPYWDQVRDTINEWWSHLPHKDQLGLKNRVLDRKSDSNVSSALWELYLHEMLIKSGFSVDVEPAVGTRGKSPDFLVSRGKEQFIVEAIWAAERVDDAAYGPLAQQLLQTIDSMPSPDFYLSVSVETAGAAAPPQKRLKSELARWLGQLDPDQVDQELQQGAPLPSHVWSELGWRLTFHAAPRSTATRRRSDNRTIGLWPTIATFRSTGSKSLFDAVKRKGNKYGELGMPFVVAVANVGAFPENEDVAASLYGRTEEELRIEGRTTSRRLPDGYWDPARESLHAQVSGVLVVDNPMPNTWSTHAPTLWRSPLATSRRAPVLPSWATARLIEGRVEHQRAGTPIHTALGLPAGWPLGDAFPRRSS